MFTQSRDCRPALPTVVVDWVRSGEWAVDRPTGIQRTPHEQHQAREKARGQRDGGRVRS